MTRRHAPSRNLPPDATESPATPAQPEPSQPAAAEPTLADRGAVLLKPTRGTHSIPRVVSLLVLVGVLVFTALLFFRVMALFVVPLFLAGVLVVVFEPVFKWFCDKAGGSHLPGGAGDHPGDPALGPRAVWPVGLVGLCRNRRAAPQRKPPQLTSRRCRGSR